MVVTDLCIYISAQEITCPNWDHRLTVSDRISFNPSLAFEIFWTTSVEGTKLGHCVTTPYTDLSKRSKEA